MQLLDRRPGCRDKAVRWQVDGIGEQGPVLERRLERVWDGMRSLPYTDAQLITALGATVTAMTAAAPESYLWLELATPGLTSRSFAPPHAVVGALRDDVDRVLRDPALAGNPEQLLQLVQSPVLLYDADRLVDLFAEYLIPWQVVHDRLDLAVYFSPVRVAVIGKA